MRLNTNENSYDVPAEVVDAVVAGVAEVAGSLNRYPDREFTALREDLAAYLSATSGVPVTPDQVWAGNGSNEVLLHLLQAFGGPGRTALGFTPAYSMHPIITRTVGTTWVDGLRGVPGGGAFDLDRGGGRRAGRASTARTWSSCARRTTRPAPPSGWTWSGPPTRPRPDAIVVVDEAYAEFARPGTPSALTLLEGRERLVVTRTMSKAFALAGGRLGYLAATPELSDALRLVRHALPPVRAHPGGRAGGAGPRRRPAGDGRGDQGPARPDRRRADRARAGARAQRRQLRPLRRARATSTPPGRPCSTQGILVRDVGLAHYLRVTAGTPAETDAFLAAMGRLAPTHRQEQSA